MEPDNALEIDELSLALRAHLQLDDTKTEEGDKKNQKKEEQQKSTSYDRWTLQDDSKVNYGFLGRTGGKGIEEASGGFYITTAINYTNGAPHMGHAYEAATADVLARFHRLLGDKPTYFVTGSDEHGQKVVNTALDQGRQPIDICNQYATGFKILNQRILITSDDYIRTTSDRHKRTAQEVWKRCDAAGDVYLGTYRGWYNVREEAFVTDSQAALHDYKDPASGKPLKQVEEESYFFRMSKYRDRLIQHIESHPEFIMPEAHRNLILSRLKSDELRDLSISRATFSWGISVPEGFNAKHVMYVWVDALSNYLTGVNELGINQDGSFAGLEKFWPADVHIIGKDILWFHTVIWPCLLMSAGVPLAKTVFAHGFINDKEGKKMAKTLGNVVDPHDMLDKFDVDTLRWYLCKEAPYGGDLSFSEDSLRAMHKDDLCDTLGNLVNRATNLCSLFCDGIVPDIAAPSKQPVDLAKVIETYRSKLTNFELRGGAQVAIQGFGDVNGYLEDEKPWSKKGDEFAEQRQIIVRATLESIYALAHLLLPFLPVGASKIFKKLNTEPVSLPDLDLGCRNLKAGTKIEVGDVLYGKYEQPDFTKIDIRVGKIQNVWPHPDADKLYCEQIDVGDESGPREIASGLRDFYKLEEMQDRKVLVVCNLKAVKMVGFASQGMVLAAKCKDGSKVELVAPPDDAPIGERVFIQDLSGEPVASTQVKKKKLWDVVAAKLKTGDGGIALWAGKIIQTSAGPCKASSLVGAAIS